jgi:predicted membrane protein
MNFHKHNFSHDNQPQKCSSSDGLPIMGFVFLGLGLVFLFDRLGIIPSAIRHIIISWQALIIFIGAINLIKPHSRFAGIILILVGGAFLLPRIIDVPFETKQLIWPVILIFVGLLILLKTNRIKQNFNFKRTVHSFGTSEQLDELAIFGGSKRIITTQNLKGGNITAIFGGVELDLSEADFEGDVAVIDLTAIFGGATLIVKSEWEVQLQITSIMGGFTDKRKVYKGGTGSKTLIIKGAAIFGGGEVKSF